MRFLALCAALAGALTLSACGSSVPVVGDYSLAGRGNTHFKGGHPNQHAIHGIDVSKYQGKINWDVVKEAGIKFAYIKATEGADHLDERFTDNWTRAAQAGMPRGAYHFVYWCRPWREEMDWFEANVPVDPDALPPVLDVEATPTSKTCKRTLYREEVLSEMRAMLARMERHFGKKPIIYTTVDFYESILNPNELSDYPIWVRSTKYPPHVKYPGRKWTFWQYQSDGVIPGIAGKVDRNAFSGSVDDWEKFMLATAHEQ